MNKLMSFCAYFLLLFISSCSFLKTSPETKKMISTKVESKDFTVGVNLANPLRMKPVSLTSDYTLRIKNDSAFAYLPYYGVAQIAPFSGEGGIKFAEPMIDYKMSSNKKSTGWDIQFQLKSELVLYTVSMNIYDNGSSIIPVNSFNRDVINFNGEVK